MLLWVIEEIKKRQTHGDRNVGIGCSGLPDVDAMVPGKLGMFIRTVEWGAGSLMKLDREVGSAKLQEHSLLGSSLRAVNIWEAEEASVLVFCTH